MQELRLLGYCILMIVVSYFLTVQAIQKLQGVSRNVCLILLAIVGSWLGTAIACKKAQIGWAFWFSIVIGIGYSVWLW